MDNNPNLNLKFLIASIKQKPSTVAKTPEYSLLKTVFIEKGITETVNLEIRGIKAGILFDHSSYSLPNFFSKNRSSANIIRS